MNVSLYFIQYTINFSGINVTALLHFADEFLVNQSINQSLFIYQRHNVSNVL